ncbi:glycoside hydrolase family 26 protein [Kitasatospora phosalacinea]|uniref:glycoside hydrolase family 26 protein n=1 Tax=Kitasatospora phosalacinea TaxID=2065 RepID=UPI00068EEB54|nr:glycosyl hydrolase [Kitasatospora phosalacinea]
MNRRSWCRGAAALVLLATGVSCSAQSEGTGPAGALFGEDRDQSAPSPAGTAPRSPAVPPTKADLMRPDGVYFGVSTYQTPLAAETDAVAAAAGRQPTMLQYFLDWRKEFDPETVREIYRQGAVPMLTWEPGDAPYQADQSGYTTRRIADGEFDAYVTRFARAVRDQQWPVVLRFAHEMNGDWYPWAANVNGNRPGDYAAAWRHVHDVFTREHADNVIWLWSPNVLRGTSADLRPLYPGDAYVDWLGMDGYGFGEATAGEVLDPTYVRLREIADKPVFVSETGAMPGAGKADWITDMFRWIAAHPKVPGFVWFEHSVEEGGRYDYRFTADQSTRKAFADGLGTLKLRGWPVADRPAS